MTVQELRDLLATYPPDTRVVVAGYEGGLDDANKVKLIKIELDFNKEEVHGSYMGVHGGFNIRNPPWCTSYFGIHEEINKHPPESNFVEGNPLTLAVCIYYECKEG